MGVLKTITKQLVVIVPSLVVGMIIWKSCAALTVRATYYPPIVVTDTVLAHHQAQIVLKDTARPRPALIQRITERIVVPVHDTVYLPVSSADSAQFASLWLVDHESYDHGNLVLDAVNLRTKGLRRSEYEITNSNFEIGTNAEGVWVLQHRQFASWDGLSAGLGYNGEGYFVVRSGISFFHSLDLVGRFDTYNTRRPFGIELTWRFLK